MEWYDLDEGGHLLSKMLWKIQSIHVCYVLSNSWRKYFVPLFKPYFKLEESVV